MPLRPAGSVPPLSTGDEHGEPGIVDTHPEASATAPPLIVNPAGPGQDRDVLLRLPPPQRLGTLMIFACMAALATMISGVITVVQALRGASRLSDPGLVYDSSLFRPPPFYGVCALCAIVLLIFTLVWFHHAYRNNLRRGHELRFPISQAVWPWFVPVFGWIRPKQVADDIWRMTTSDPDDRRPWDREVDARVNLWWALWISAGLVLGAAMILAPHGSPMTLATVHRTQWADVVLAAGCALQVIAIGLLVWFIFTVTGIQDDQGRRDPRLTRWGAKGEGRAR